MFLYKINLKCKTEFIGEIKANTLFGAFCHACTLKYNTNNIENYINDIVFSNLFPNDNYPIGISKNNIQYKKNNYTSIKKTNITRTLISRNDDTNNVPIILNGTYNNTFFSFFVCSNCLFNQEEMETIVKLMLNFGFGKWRNVGKGQFDFISIENFEKQYIDMFTQSKKLVALSDFQLSNKNEYNNLLDIGYIIRKARATNGCEQEQYLFLKTGTTFNKIELSTPQILTTTGNHIYDEKSKTYIHAKSILLGV